MLLRLGARLLDLGFRSFHVSGRIRHRAGRKVPVLFDQPTASGGPGNRTPRARLGLNRFPDGHGEATIRLPSHIVEYGQRRRWESNPLETALQAVAAPSGSSVTEE